MTQISAPHTNGSSAQSPADDLLTLAEVAERTGWNVERLRVYVTRTALNTFVGARPKKGSRGVGYPASSLPFFTKLLADADAKKVVPTTLSGWLSEFTDVNALSAQSPNGHRGAEGTGRDATLSGTHVGSSALVLSGTGLQALVELPDERWSILEELATALHRLPPPEDRLIDAREAALLLCCAPGSVRRHVRPVLRGRWRRGDILRYIGSLGR